ncbi:MAG: type II toxin-antitoxin system HigB family toxin [Marinifilaceae bacterium]
MNIISRKKILEFVKKHNQAKIPLFAIYETLEKGNFRNSQEITEAFPRSSARRNNQIVFRVKGNAYRMIIQFDYSRQIGFIKFVGTHAEYDKL